MADEHQGSWYGKRLATLHEHPAMALEIFGAVALSGRARFQLREDQSAFPLGPGEVGLHVVDIDQSTVNDVWDAGPLFSTGTVLTMDQRALVVGTGCGQHDHPISGLHFSMSQAAILSNHARPLDEAEGPGQPLQACATVGIRDHRNDIGILIRHVSPPRPYSISVTDPSPA